MLYRLRWGIVLSCVLSTYLARQVTNVAAANWGEIRTTDELRRLEKRLQDLVQKVAPAVVTFRTASDKFFGSTGVVFDESGLILTHGHGRFRDLRQSDKIEVRFADGRVAPAKQVRIVRGEGGDWSLLKITKPGKWPAVPLRFDDPPKVDDICFHLGCPAELTLGPGEAPSNRQLLRLGRVVGLSRFGVYATCLTVGGDSGGPLFDLQGRIIGLCNRSSSSSRGIGFWVRVQAFADEQTLLALPSKEERRRITSVPVGKHRVNLAKPFEDLLEPARRSTVQVLVDDKPVALGVIVDSGGVILTKRSEILTANGNAIGKLTCRLHDGRVEAAELVAEEHRHDVALVRVPGENLPTAPWSHAENQEQGSVVALVGLGREPLSVGVISTEAVYEVKPLPGYTGFRVAVSDGGVRVRIDEKSPLEKWNSYAWNKVHNGDLITHFDSKPTPDLNSYLRAWEGVIAGERIRMTLIRDGEKTRILFPTTAGLVLSRSHLSLRRTGFPEVFGFDAVASREQCGGPLIDSTGRVIGVNIASHDNHQMLAIPHTVIRRLVNELRNTSAR